MVLQMNPSQDNPSVSELSSPNQSGLPVVVAPREPGEVATPANSNQVNVVSESKVSDADTRCAEIISLRQIWRKKIVSSSYEVASTNLYDHIV